MASAPATRKAWFGDRVGLQKLIDTLREDGYQVLGPTVRNGAVEYSPIERVEDLPLGYEETQTPAGYQLDKTTNQRAFGILHGPSSGKRHFFPPNAPIWASERVGTGYQIQADPPDAPKTALLGLRPCDLHAIAIQDRVFLYGPHLDPLYAARRENTLLIAVNCHRVQATCFCTSMGGHPRAQSGYDLAIDELGGEPGPFVFEAGTPKGADLLGRCGLAEASDQDLKAAEAQTDAAAAAMGKGLQMEGIKELLYRNAENPHWQTVAERCFACTSCTQVCPTCFCHTPLDRSSLDGTKASRIRVWDSCFAEEFSYIHGGAVRRSVGSRYRQWLTHKLASWQDQFGTPGCVGCGRCVTWCPAGIDLRDEAEAIRRSDLVTNRA